MNRQRCNQQVLGARWVCAAAIFCLLSAPQTKAQFGVNELIGRFVQDPSDAKYADVARAIELLERKDASAQTALAAAAAAHPELAPAGMMAAEWYFQMGDVASARAALEQATSDAPADPEAYLVLGDLALHDGRLTEADLLYRRAGSLVGGYEKNPTRKQILQIGAYSGLAAASGGRKQWADVKKVAEAWLAIDGKSPRAMLHLGRAQFFLGETQAAYATFGKQHELDPAGPVAEINMGLLYEELAAAGDQAKHANAKRAMLKAAEDHPKDLAVRITVAQWAVSTCEIDLAVEHAKAATALAPDAAEGFILLGTAARHQDDLPAAEAALRKAVALAPAEFAATNQLALVLASAEKAPEKLRLAFQYARLNVAANSDLGQVMGREAAVTLAYVMHLLGQSKQAEAGLRQALAAGSVGGDAAYFASLVLSARGDEKTAQAILQQALSRESCFAMRKKAESRVAD